MVRSAAAVLATSLLCAPDLAKAADVDVLYAGSLVNLMEHGVGPAFDAGFFYSTETSDLKVPAIPLPPEVSLGAAYTISIARDAADPAAAARFVDFLLSAPGQAVMKEHGLDVVTPKVTGDAAEVPAAVHMR